MEASVMQKINVQYEMDEIKCQYAESWYYTGENLYMSRNLILQGSTSLVSKIASTPKSFQKKQLACITWKTYTR